MSTTRKERLTAVFSTLDKIKTPISDTLVTELAQHMAALVPADDFAASDAEEKQESLFAFYPSLTNDKLTTWMEHLTKLKARSLSSEINKNIMELGSFLYTLQELLNDALKLENQILTACETLGDNLAFLNNLPQEIADITLKIENTPHSNKIDPTYYDQLNAEFGVIQKTIILPILQKKAQEEEQNRMSMITKNRALKIPFIFNFASCATTHHATSTPPVSPRKVIK